MKKTTALILSICLIFILCSGCVDEPEATSDTTYNMGYGLDAHGYHLFMNKEMSSVLNQLSTQMILALRAADSGNSGNALESAKASLKIMEDSYHEIEIMHPPAQYAENRDNVLRIIMNARKHMEAYIKDLSNDTALKSSLLDHSSILQTDFIELTAEFNIYYK